MRIKRFVIPCLLTALMLVLFTSAGVGKDIDDNRGFRKPVGVPVRSLLNINLLALWAYADGISAHNPNTDGSGLIFPHGTYGAGVIYLDGLILGGYVLDGRAPSLRTTGTTYRTSLRPGWIVSKGVAADETLDEVRMYRIRPDFPTADLAFEAATIVDGAVADMTDADIQAVRDQYLLDWQAWPVDVGAPFDDVGYLGADGETIVDADNGTLDYGEDTNMNGVLDAGEDANGNEMLDGETPGFAGADQVLWFACNDLDETRTMNLGGCPPVGIEIQVTLWGYNRTDALGNVAFKRFRLFYKGTLTTPTDAVVDSVFFAHFSDPDLGDYGNDFVGCDTTLDMMFVYNSVSQDANFVAYNYPPPAVGYDFLQGPMVQGEAGDVAIYDMQLVDGMKNLGMTTFNYFAAGSQISDPNMGIYEGTEQWYNLMNGLTPRGGIPFTLNDGVTPTLFPLSGDPVTGEGDLDGVILPASDRRMQFITGPFDIEFGTQQELVMAYVAGMGADRLSSVSVMKFNDIAAQYAYDNFFDLAKPPDAPVMQITAMDGKAFLNWGYDAAGVASTEGVVKKGFAFEGYNVYQMPTAASGISEAKKLATYDVVNETTTIMDDQFDQVSGGILSIPSQTGKNTGIVRNLVVDTDVFTDGPLVNGTTYYFAVTAYSYNGDPSVPVHALESQVLVKSLTPQTPDPGDRYHHEQGEALEVEHEGTAIAFVDVNVLDQTQVTGHDYKVWFNQQHYYCNELGKWITTSYADSVGKLSKPTDLTGSSLSGAAVWSTTAGKVNLNFYVDVVSPDYNYCDGVEITFPAGITINSASSADADYTIDGNTVMFGTTDLTGGGPFSGGQVVSVNVDGFTPPLTVDYTMFDDGWATGYGEPYASLGDGIVDVDGSVTITEIGNEFMSIFHWNLWDVDDAENVLEDQTVNGGINTERVENGIYYPGGEGVGMYDVRVDGALVDFVDAFQLSVSCGYLAPEDFHSYSTDGDGTFSITSYGIQGWSGGEGTARSIDAYGFGTTELDLLQRDYELRFTGEYDTPITVGAMTYHPIKEGTGSLAVLYGARGYTLDAHPSPNNPGDGSPFFIRIPFEVWDMENVVDGEVVPRQVAMIIYDRMQAGVIPGGGDVYAFNPANRVYCEFLMAPYADFIAASADAYLESDLLTWNTVWWTADWVQGEVLTFVYSNPIQLGVDEFTFSTTAPSYSEATAKDDVKEVNVFPNPYYGVNARETTESSRFVTFNHLPQKANFMIFDLAGTLVRRFEKDADSQYFRWNLRNDNDLPVASGIYIVRIEFPDLDKKVKILKVALCVEAQFVPIF